MLGGRGLFFHVIEVPNETKASLAVPRRGSGRRIRDAPIMQYETWLCRRWSLYRQLYFSADLLCPSLVSSNAFPKLVTVGLTQNIASPHTQKTWQLPDQQPRKAVHTELLAVPTPKDIFCFSHRHYFPHVTKQHIFLPPTWEGSYFPNERNSPSACVL